MISYNCMYSAKLICNVVTLNDLGLASYARVDIYIVVLFVIQF